MKFRVYGDLEGLENCRIDKLNNSCKIGVASAFVPLEEDENLIDVSDRLYLLFGDE